VSELIDVEGIAVHHPAAVQIAAHRRKRGLVLVAVDVAVEQVEEQVEPHHFVDREDVVGALAVRRGMLLSGGLGRSLGRGRGRRIALRKDLPVAFLRP
jgi:hypothetical protein